MRTETISLKEAQRLILASQKLLGPTLDPLQIIEHLGYVQIDTISVVERAHHHTFWTRNKEYRPDVLDQLLKDRMVFEYWSHAASFLPMSDYRYTLPMKRTFRKKYSSWFPRDTKLMSAVLRRIKNEGPLRSKDFENTKRGTTGWWDWKPAKKALERLFLEGKLEVSRREGFQKVYDLPQRVIPNSVDTSMPNDKEYIRFLISRTLRHHGLATSKEIAYLRKSETKLKVEKELNGMLSNQEVIELKVGGIDETYYTFPGYLEEIPRATQKIIILSPFDNLTIQRKKLLTFFNFDYQIECYVPEKKRKYRYFSLPIFKGTQPIARIDCKANRKEKILEIHSISYEKNVNRATEKSRFESKLTSFAKFNGCNSVHFIK